MDRPEPYRSEERSANRTIVLALSIIFTLLALSLAARYVHAQPLSPEACFRPGPISCEALVLREISSAKRTVDFEAYSLTDSFVVAALRAAVAQGVKVRSVVDRTSRLADQLPGDVWTDCSVSIMHNKVVIVDGESVGLGSFNFSNTAEHHNAENHVWIHDASLAARFTAEFEQLVAASIRGTACR